jgi:hypothetical protein
VDEANQALVGPTVPVDLQSGGLMSTLMLVFGWLVAVFFGLLELSILLWLWRDPSRLNGLISEIGSGAGGPAKASLSRFQFLVFTFVIGMSFFLIVVGNSPLRFPQVPSGVFALLGVSGGAYVVSKGIQKAPDAAGDAERTEAGGATAGTES